MCAVPKPAPEKSPYAKLAPEKWEACTKELIAAHPLSTEEAVDVVLTSWSAILKSKIGGKLTIGKDIQPKPQIMGFFLHELIPLELADRQPKLWRPEKAKGDKDIVYVPDSKFSIEIKTSSHASQIFGNRSYAQEQTGQGKSKNGYYLAVNFTKFVGADPPKITKVRFGWLDHTDWLGQKAATGQQARVSPDSDRRKLITIYTSE